MGTKIKENRINHQGSVPCSFAGRDRKK